MKEIENLKKYIASAIVEVEVEGITINKSYAEPNKKMELPLITYRLLQDNMEHSFNNNIKKQRALFDVTIHAKTKKEISDILLALKNTMLKHGIFFRGGFENVGEKNNSYTAQYEVKV